MQNFSSLISPAQAALNNAKTQNYGSLQSPNTQYSSMAPIASYAPTSQPMATSTVTGKPVAGSITGTPNPVHTAITQIANNANKAILSHANTAHPLGTASNPQTGFHADPLMSAPAQTPQQIAASQGLTQTGGGTDGMAPQYGTAPTTDSTGATFPGLVGGMLGTGTPAQMAANQTPSGLLGNNIGQTQGILQNQQGMITPFIQQNLDTIKAATQEAEQLTGGSYSGTAADYSGRLAQLENIKQAAQGNINSASANLGTFSGQASGALQGGLTAATQQVQAPYGTPLYNPLSGSFTTPGGTTGGGGLDPNTQGTQLAQQVTGGTMDFNTALSQMGAYGAAGAPALRNAILKINPSFNFNLSQSSASTQAQGQQIKTAADSTNKALDTLAAAFTSLPGWQTGGIPATNSIGQWLGQQLGDKALQAFKTNLADARSQLIGVLNSSGGTPTGNEATANQYLPDNMTKAMFDTNVGTVQNPGIVRQLVAQKVGSFTGSGQQNPPVTQNQNASSNIFSW